MSKPKLRLHWLADLALISLNPIISFWVEFGTVQVNAETAVGFPNFQGNSSLSQTQSYFNLSGTFHTVYSLDTEVDTANWNLCGHIFILAELVTNWQRLLKRYLKNLQFKNLKILKY